MATINERTINTKCGRYGPQKVYKCYECFWIQMNSDKCECCDSYCVAEVKRKIIKKKNKKLSFISDMKELKKELATEISKQTRDFCCEEIYHHVVDKIAEAPAKVIQLMPLFGAAPIEEDYDVEESSVVDEDYLSDENHSASDNDERNLGQQTIFDGKDMTKKFWSFAESDFSFLLQATEILRNGVSQKEAEASFFSKICKKLNFSNPISDKVKLVEDLFCVFYFVYKMHLQKIYRKDKKDCIKFTDIIEICLLTFKIMSKDSLITIGSDQMGKFVNKVHEIFGKKEEYEFEVQSNEFDFHSMRDLLDNYDLFKGSVLIKKIYKLSMYLISSSLFARLGVGLSDLGYNQFEREAMKKKYYLGPDFIHCLFDTVIFLCERGYQSLQTGSFQPFLYTEKSYVEFVEQAELLKRQSRLLQNPEAHGFNESSFRADLDKAIERGDAICRYTVKLDASEKRFLRSLTNELQMIKCDLCTRAAAREHRTPPYSILVSGDSGIGKSTIKDMLFYHFGKVCNLDVDKTFCYTRNPVAKFWDGFTTSQWAIILDDVAFMHPNKAASGDPSCMEFLQIINAVPFVPDQADLNDKGRTPLRCKLCIATTNTRNLNAHHYFSFPSAAQRRFPYVVVPTVKIDFTTESGMLDSSKTINVSGEYPDYWNWKVLRIMPTKRGLATEEVVLETDDVCEFMQWYTKSIQNFNHNQTVVEESIDGLKDIILCKLCYLPEKKCTCDIQSGGTAIIGAYLLHVLNWTIVLFCYNYFMTYVNYYASVFSVHTTATNWLWFSLPDSVRRGITTIRVSRIGKKVESSLNFQTFVTIGFWMTFVYKIYKLTYKNKIQSTEGYKPEAKDRERENVWYNDSYDLSSFDLTPQSTSSNGLSREDFMSMISRELVHIVVTTERNTIVTIKATCLRGQIYFTNNHNIPNFDTITNLDITMQSTKDGVTTNLRCALTNSDIIERNSKTDTIFFYLRGLPPKRGVEKYLLQNDVTLRLNGCLLSREGDGSVTRRNVSRTFQTAFIGSGKIREFNGVIIGVTNEGVPTVDGDCGSLLVIESPLGYFVAGFHVIAQSGVNRIFSVPVTAQTVKSVSDALKFEIQSGMPILSSKSAERSVGELSHKSIFRYFDSGSAAVYGSFTGFRRAGKSRVELTPLAPILSKSGYKIKFGPPVMKGWEPWRIAAQDMIHPVVDINGDVLKDCVNSFYDDIIGGLSSKDLNELHIYDDFTAINGADGVAYVDKINRTTSAGNPWKCSKKKFMSAIPEMYGMQHPVEVSDEIMDRAMQIVSTYKKGERAYPNFCAHLKDEPVSFKKIKAKKTRVFTGAPFDWTIVVRKYLLSSIRLIQNNRIIFEAAPGTVAQSYEWHQMYEYITKFGEDRIIAGDYKAFDKRMSPHFISAAFDILIRLCKKSGNYDEDDIMVLEGIKKDTAFPLVDFNGDLVQFYGSNPSGHPLTVIINSLVNSLYMRYAYHLLNPNSEVKTFRDNVSLMTYGDDNIMSVAKHNSWYNHTTVSAAFATMGITYTMADKDAESIPLIHIRDASFLKRTWNFDHDGGAYFAPLDHSSIEKMLMVWVRSKTISTEEQMLAVITSAVREYFFYGRIIYEEKIDLLKNLVKQVMIEDWVLETTFPTFDQLVKEFWENSRRVCGKDIVDQLTIENKVFNLPSQTN